MKKKCPYCMSKRITALTGTVYCQECQSYFRMAGDELVPIFIENREVYRKYQKTEERRILCAVCQERNEMENEKKRAEEEQWLKLNKDQIKQKSTHESTSHLCRACVERVNEKLEKDREKYYEPYRKFIQRKRIVGFLVFIIAVAISKLTGGVVGSAVLSLFMIREIRTLESVVASLVFCALSCYSPYFVVLFGAIMLYSIFMKRRCKEIIYLRFNIDVEKMQREILRKVKVLRIGSEREKEPEMEDRRSFLHAAYNSHVKKNEEVAEIAKGIADLKIKDTWYGKVDKMVEWLANT
ncbi:hypothetical protein NEMIN01_1496 [Nematocida minor]|uniref:uncharacterized protein n=1 Tax=Nematocida minor TaxID=1912983 RepID=UPI00221FBB42|nr:uncharacterized protein NEMIN01_1496 [Nematocida minor]KAI5191420.1 hypothetical protein NEMIN01_1496 [Nematocida minor]